VVRIGKANRAQRGMRIEDAIRILNSVFRTAKIDARIVSFSLAREEVVIGFPQQVESFENELTDVEGAEDLRVAARYIAVAEINTRGRITTALGRFYLRTDGKVVIEDASDQSITLINEQEAGKRKQWQQIGRFLRAIMDSIIKALVEIVLRKWQQ